MKKRRLKKQYRKLWSVVRGLMLTAGLVMIYGAIGTDDLYTMELVKAAPQSVETNLIIGAFLTIPSIVNYVKTKRRG